MEHFIQTQKVVQKQLEQKINESIVTFPSETFTLEHIWCQFEEYLMRHCDKSLLLLFAHLQFGVS